MIILLLMPASILLQVTLVTAFCWMLLDWRLVDVMLSITGPHRLHDSSLNRLTDYFFLPMYP